jgi:8-oxo-dGTP diphosphatase
MTAMTVVRVVGAAIRRDGRWLAAQRSPSMSEPLRWEFPGGKVEPGETDEAALVRELGEELGVTVAVGSLIGIGHAARGERTIELRVHEASLLEGEPEPREHARLGWYTADELANLDWAEADVPIVRTLLSAR